MSGRAVGRRRNGVAMLVVGLIPLGVLLALWQILGNEHDPRFPTPSVWITAIEQLFRDGSLLPALGSTTMSFLIALALSLVVGGLLGVLVGSVPAVARALGPLLEFLRVTPAAAVAPIAVLLIGTTSLTTIVVVVFAAIWPILLSTASAVQSLPAIRMDVARSLALSKTATLGKVVIPSLVPGVALGVRIATPICLVVVLVAEMLTSTGGVGQLLIQRQHSYDAAAVFGLLVIIGVLGLAVNIAVNTAERALTTSFATQRR